MVKLNCTTISDYIIKNADVENLTIPKKMLQTFSVAELYSNDDYLPLYQWIVSRRDMPPQELYFQNWLKYKSRGNQLIGMLWIIYRQNQPLPKEFVYPNFTRTKDKQGNTPLHMWIQYRPQEPIPEYLLTKNCLNVLGADGPALFCWIKYRKNEPIPQQLLCNIVYKQVTTPFTDFQFQDTDAATMWLMYRPTEPLPDILINKNWDIERVTKFIQKWLEYKHDEPLPDYIHSQLKFICETNKQLCNKIISYEIIYKTTLVDEDVIYDFQPHDLSPQFNFIQMWCENRKTQPIPKFLEPLITNYTKFQKIYQNQQDEDKVTYTTPIKLWIMNRQGEPIPQIILNANWNKNFYAALTTICDFITNRPGEPLPQEFLQPQYFRPQASNQKVPLYYWLMYRPLEPIPKYLLFNGCRQFVCSNSSETPLQKWLSVVFRSTTIDENTKINILLEPPKELLYPYWQIQKVQYETETPLILLINSFKCDFSKLTKNQLQLLQKFLYMDCFYDIIHEKTGRLNVDLSQKFIPQSIIETSIDLSKESRQNNCCICFTDDSNKTPVVKICDNDHPDTGLCIQCFLRLCYEHRYNISTLKCPMCKAKLSLPKPKSYQLIMPDNE